MAQNNSATSGYDIMPMSRLAMGGRWRTEAMRSYSRPVVMWFTKGQGRITVNGVKRGYGPHNAIVLPAGTMHGFDMLGQVLGHVVFFPNSPDLGLPDSPVHLRIRDARRQAELNGFIEQIGAELNKADEASVHALSLISGLLAVWLGRQTALRDPDFTEANASNRLAAAYTSLLERDFRAPKGVSAYARELGVTPTHLSQVCNFAMGRPASQMRAERIHLEARRMLRHTDLQIQEIATRLGFASAAYFTRAFQRNVGHTPSHFRKSGHDIPA